MPIRSLMKLVTSLGELHTTVRNTRSSGKPSTPSKDTLSSSDLLGLGGDKGERRAKIRELVDEVCMELCYQLPLTPLCCPIQSTGKSSAH